jgi:MFS family permease
LRVKNARLVIEWSHASRNRDDGGSFPRSYRADVTSARQVLRHSAVRRYLVSTAFAAVGQNLLVTVLFKQVFDITGDELDIGIIGLAQFVPALVLVLAAGWVADRFDRRRVSALSLAGRGGCALALVVYSSASPGTVWQLFAIAFVLGASDAMLAPARRSITPLIVEQAEFHQVIALWTATFTASSIVGPVLGGFLYSIGPGTAYLVAGVLQFAAIVPMLGVVYRREQERLTDRPTFTVAMEGLHFVRRTPIVLAVISLDLFAVLFGGAVALIPAIAGERLGVGDIAYGWLRAAPGIGAATMAIWLAVRPIRRRVGPMLLWVVAVFGAGTTVFGLTRSYTVAFIALVVISAADMVSMYIRGSIVPLVTPNDQLGRVSAVEGVFIGASNELGAFESGVAARAFGLPWAIAGGGLITVLIAGTFAVVFPSLRRVDTFEELEPVSPSSA